MDDADLNLAVEGGLGRVRDRRTALHRDKPLARPRENLRRFAGPPVKPRRRLRLGPLDPETDIGPVVNAAQLERVQNYIGIGTDEGATLLLGGEVPTGGELEGRHS